MNYKFNEDKLIEEFKKYVDRTYDQHYSGGKIQATEDIIDDGHGTGFCIGNAKKYLKRYGKKGETPAEWRKDLMKTLHYTLIQLYVHDEENKPNIKPAPFHHSGVYHGDDGNYHSIDNATPDEWNGVR